MFNFNHSLSAIYCSLEHKMVSHLRVFDATSFALFMFVAGVSSTLLQTALASTSHKLVIFSVITVCVLFALISNTKRLYCLLLASFCCGLLWANTQYQTHRFNLLDHALQGNTLVVTGQVIGLPKDQNGNTRFRFRTVKTATSMLPDNQTLQLSCYRCPLQLKTGDVWQLSVRLKRPRGYASWGAFDYEKYLFRHRIVATGYVRLKQVNRFLGSKPAYFEQQRAEINDVLESFIGEESSNHGVGYSMIRALTIGDKSGFLPVQRDVFQISGISHLMAISGLHIGLVFMCVSVFVGLLLWPFARIYEHIPKALIVLFPALFAAFYYAGLAGFSIPTQRALIMLSVYVLAKLMAQSSSLLRVLLISMVLILLRDPFSVLDMGFWLSCTAVFVIALCQQTDHQPKKHSNKHPQGSATQSLSLFRLQPLIWLGMLPLSAALFGQVSLISPLVNLVAVPLFCLILIPVTLFALVILLMGFTPISQLLFSSLSMCFEYIYQCLSTLSQFNFASRFVDSISRSEFVAVILVALMFLFVLRWRYVVLLVLALKILWAEPRSLNGEMRVSLIDVGQGLAMLVEIDDYVLLYDTGPRYRSGFTAAEATVIPYLQSRGIQHIDHIVISHADNDHIGGYQAISQVMTIGEVSSSRPDKLPNAKQCYAGQRWQHGSSQFVFVSPDKNTPKGSNNHSCVLLLSHQGVRVLITGDIEKKVERYLRRSDYDLTADVMLVPHQGSKTSSTASFIDAVSPRLALVAAGYRNHYGHPHPIVMQRYQRRHIKTLSTIDSGTIVLRIKNKKWQVIEFRESNKAFWRDQKMPNATDSLINLSALSLDDSQSDP